MPLPTVAITGHQPPILGGFTPEVDDALFRLACSWLAEHPAAALVSGLAPGWDLATAKAALALDIPLVAALAWCGQGNAWPEGARLELEGILARAHEVYVHHEERTSGMWTARDRWVLDRADTVLALWSGIDGGTGRAVARATKLGLPVVNLWDQWTPPPQTDASGPSV